MKKKILLFNGYYIPAKNYGGPTTSAENIVNSCSDVYDFYIVVADHDLGEKKPFTNIHQGWNKVGLANVLYVKNNKYLFSANKIMDLIIETNASLVCTVGIFNPYYIWPSIFVCKKLKKPLLISPRGEVCKNTFSMKAYKKKPYAWLIAKLGIFKNIYFHATSEEEKEGLGKYFKIKKGKIFLVPNISNQVIIPVKKQKEPGKIRLVFISRIQKKKNLAYAINLVNHLKCEVEFHIYGPMESLDYWNECEQLIQLAPENVNYKYCGSLDPLFVGKTFSSYDCFLFPTISENYGHVIAEALSNGCPIILSKYTTPWDDLDTKAGFVVELNKPDQFVRKLEEIAEMDNSTYTKFVDSTLRYYKNKMAENNAIQGHIEMYTKLIKSHLR